MSTNTNVTIALSVSGIFFVSCRDHSVSSSSPTAVTSPTLSTTVVAAVSSASTSALPPLDTNWLVHLPLNGFGSAMVAAPTGANVPRPILVGVHAQRDRPEWACGEWLGVTRGHPFILCPHGIPADAGPKQGLGFANADDLKREIDAGIAALRARFGRHVAEGPMIYAGFSRGAFLGVPIVAEDPEHFPVVVLGEGGQTPWTPERASQFARGGGKRVLFVCSTADCEVLAPPAVAILQRAGVEAKMITAGHLGHIVDDRVVRLIRAEWPWVVRDRAGDLGPW